MDAQYISSNCQFPREKAGNKDKVIMSQRLHDDNDLSLRPWPVCFLTAYFHYLEMFFGYSYSTDGPTKIQ